MISVWIWVGLSLIIYGGTVTVAGVIYEPKIFQINPAIVWGPLMMLAGIIFILIGRRFSGNHRRFSGNHKGDKKYLIIVLFIFGYLSTARAQQWEFDYPNPSIEGTSGLFRIVSPRSLGWRNFSIGAFLGFYDTPNNSVILISRNYFIIKDKFQEINFSNFNSTAFYGYIFLSFGGPSADIGGKVSSDISLVYRNISTLIKYQRIGGDFNQDNAQAFGDFIITPKFSYTLASKEASFALWSKVFLLSAYRYPSIAAVSIAPGISALYDFDENPYFRSQVWKDIDLLNPKVYISASINFDNSKSILGSLLDKIPAFIQTSLLIEPYNHIDIGVGIEAGDSKRGIGKYLSGFIEYSFIQYFPPPPQSSFADMQNYISVGARIKPIPLFSQIIKGIPQEIQNAQLFIGGDFNLSRVYEGEIALGPTVYLRNAPAWRIFFGVNIFWNPWEKVFFGEGGRIKFVIKDAETGSPLGDVIISFPDLGLSNLASDPSTGEATSYDLPPGEVGVQFRKAGYEVAVRKVQVEKGILKEIEVEMVKEKAVSSVFGTVRSPTGAPVTARIEVEGANIPPLFSDPIEGKYELGIPAGTYKLNFSAEGYNPTKINLKLSPGEKKRLDVILEQVTVEKREIGGARGETLLKEEQKKFIYEKQTKRLLLSEKILFEPEKEKILPYSQDTLKELAEYINREFKGKKIRIEVHTFRTKNPAYDKELSERRAEEIVNILTKFGIPREYLIPVGKGSEFPIIPADTPEARGENERVEFFIAE